MVSDFSPVPNTRDAAAAIRVLIEAQPRPGAWNMAVDEVLLEAALARGEPAVRCYRWSEPTVSLGYFQSASEAAGHPWLASLPAVRRMTGGGAILHHHELTYSCAVPAAHPFAHQPLRLYEEVHRAIISLLATRGVTAGFRGASPRRDGPFLCFGRGDPRDIVAAGHKILGSAQRRRRGAVLQHGSLLLRASPLAVQFPGLDDLVGRRAIAEEDAARLADALAAALGIPGAAQSGLSLAEHDRALALASERYSRLDWPGTSAILTVAGIPRGGYHGN